MITCGQTKIYIVKNQLKGEEYDNKFIVSKCNKHLISGSALSDDTMKLLAEKDEEFSKQIEAKKKLSIDAILHYYCVKDNFVISSAQYTQRIAIRPEINLSVVYTNPKFRKKGYTHDFCDKTIDDMFNRFGFDRINSSAVSKGGLHLLDSLDFLVHDDAYQFRSEIFVRKYNPKLAHYKQINQELIPIKQFVAKFESNLGDGSQITDYLMDEV